MFEDTRMRILFFGLAATQLDRIETSRFERLPASTSTRDKLLPVKLKTSKAVLTKVYLLHRMMAGSVFQKLPTTTRLVSCHNHISMDAPRARRCGVTSVGIIALVVLIALQAWHQVAAVVVLVADNGAAGFDNSTSVWLFSDLFNNNNSNATTATTATTTATTRRSSKQKDDLHHYRLELLHIPKTGGTTLEVIGLQQNISWGACHFEFPWKRNARNPLRNCPKLNNTSSSSSSSSSKEASSITWWHYPIQNLSQAGRGGGGGGPYDNNNNNDNKTTVLVNNNPYDNMPVGEEGTALGQKLKKFFVVVRNPYDRYISLFFMRTRHNTMQQLNVYLQQTIRTPDNMTSLFCQSDFVFDPTTGQRVVDADHVLHFESLKDEFEALANDVYGLNLTVPRHKRKPPPLNAHNLTRKTRRMLHEKCPRDFELGPYEMLDDKDD